MLRILNIKVQDYSNYKKASLFVGIGTCNWKCCRDAGVDISICQNSKLAKSIPIICESDKFIDDYFFSDSLQEACVVGGLEPFDDFSTLYELAKTWGIKASSFDFVVYTGYYKEEIADKVSELKKVLPDTTLIIKFGRFIPDSKSRFDSVLGVNLVSDNQYAEVII